jgi:hypothetical protein
MPCISHELRIRTFMFCRDTAHQCLQVESKRSDFVNDDECSKECRIVTDSDTLGDLSESDNLDS